MTAYYRQRQLPSNLALARELDLVPRRVRAVLDRDFDHVAMDVVDRALCHAVEAVFIGGRWVVTLEDLYPLAA
jgi:hypothetical protein